MYNRYIPQSDGTYQKNRIPDQRPIQPQPTPTHREPEPIAQVQHNSSPGQSVSGFLRNLLPKEFDTGDLLVVLLLLLMAENNKEDQNTALLTLALYFFM